MVVTSSAKLTDVRLALRDLGGRKHLIGRVAINSIRSGRSYVVLVTLERSAVSRAASLTVRGRLADGRLARYVVRVPSATAAPGSAPRS